MAPIRRYLRITKYSVLEVRIYPDKPSEAPWLLSARDPVLPRIIQAVRPQVLPKLREENENAKKKGGRKKRKGIKDVASQHDFDVTIFLTESSSRHTLLTKRKRFVDKPKLTSTGRRLTGWLDGHSHNDRENPIAIDEEEVPPDVLQQVDEVPELRDIPEATDKGKRRADPDDDGGDDALFVSSSSDEASSATQRGRPQKRDRRSEPGEGEAEVEDEKKKLGLTTSYDGFSIYGRILCLVVKRKGPAKAPPPPPSGSVPGSASQMMERWVSTQAAQAAGLHDEEEEEG